MRILILLFLLSSCIEKPYCKTVSDVGGCDNSGCGVLFTDESFGNAKYPVKGRYMCRKKEIFVPAEDF